MIDSNQIVIKYDVAKRKKMLWMPIALIIFSAVMIVLIVSADRIKIFYLAMFILVLVGAIYGIFVLVKSINSKDLIGLSLTEQFVKFNGTSSGKEIGAVSWVDVESISTSIQHRTKQIYLKLKNPDQYITKNSPIEMANYGFFINSTELEISFEELEKLLQSYLQKYGNNSIDTNPTRIS